MICFLTLSFAKQLSSREERSMPLASIVIDPRFNGFPDIALGGYVGGVLARGRPRDEVVLLRPVQIGKPYETATTADGTTLGDGKNVFAIVRDTQIDLDIPQPVDLETSKLASKGYVGHQHHLIPTCFVCGPSRPDGDGLRIFPGIVPGRDVVAAPWTPWASLADSNGQVEPEFIWSALDCPTIWGFVLNGRPDTDERAVTARLAVELMSPVTASQPQIVMGWKVGESGRTRIAGGAIYSTDGHLLAKAKHTLVTTSWGVPMGLNYWK
jgi:hypothetical protein